MYTSTPVTTQIMRTDTMAPSTSALCQPKDIFWLLGLAAIQMAMREIMKEAKSANTCIRIVWTSYTSYLLKDEQHLLQWQGSLKRNLQQPHKSKRQGTVEKQKSISAKPCEYIILIINAVSHISPKMVHLHIAHNVQKYHLSKFHSSFIKFKNRLWFEINKRNLTFMTPIIL